MKREFPGEKRPSMQAVAVNQRRERFRDPRVRQAIGMCFDFEWTNRNLFYDAYQRSQSCFERSDYKAVGLPSPEELALLEPLRETIPDEAFGEAVIQPVSDGSGRDRKLLGAASKLLDEAGWKRRARSASNGKGQRLTVEILIDDDTFARIFGPWTEIMKVDRHRRIDPDCGFGAVPGKTGRIRLRPHFDGAVVQRHADARRDCRVVPIPVPQSLTVREICPAPPTLPSTH